MQPVALLGLVGAHRRFRELGAAPRESQSVTTPFGKSNPIHLFSHKGIDFCVLSRYGEESFTIPPSHVNDRANIWGLKVLGVEKAVAIASPGSMREEVKPGDIVVPHDVLDEKKVGSESFFEGKRWAFLRSFPLFCPELRQAFGAGVATSGFTLHGKGLYVCTPGPRLETASQIRVYRHHGGDVVGQALLPETHLARELEICYAAFCYASYWAEGISPRSPDPAALHGGLLSEPERVQVERLERSLPEIFLLLLPHIAKTPRSCPCPRTLDYYRNEKLIGDDWKTWIK